MALLWPFGDANPTFLAPDDAAAIELEIFDRLTYAKLTDPAAAVTITLDISEETPDGSLLIIDVEQAGTGRNITLSSTYFVGTGITGVADDRDVLICFYNKTLGKFIVIARTKIIDAA